MPDVVKRTLGLRAINCSFTDEFMHRNTRRSSRSKAVVTSAGSNHKTTTWRGRQHLCTEEPGTKTTTAQTRAFSSANELIHFIENYTGVKTDIGALRSSPRGSAQISTTNGATLRLHKPPVCERQGCKQYCYIRPSVCLVHPRCASPCPIVLTLSH